MEINLNQNLNDQLKIDISQSNLEVTNSIEAFNKNLNKMDKVLNSNNDLNTNSNINISDQKILQNIQSSSDTDNIGEPFYNQIDNNRYNIKLNNISKNPISNKKIADPTSDILCQKLQQRIDSLTYENYTLNKKNKDLMAKNKELKLNLTSLNHAKETELQIANEEISNNQMMLKRKEEDILILQEKIKLNDKDQIELEKNKKNIYELKFENEKLINNNQKLNQSIMNLEQNLEFYKNKFNELSSNYDIMRKDKEYINRELFIQKEKNKELNDENENIINEINDIKRDKEQLIKKIREYDMNKKKEFNDLINKTKEKLEEKQKEEINKINDTNLMNLKIKLKSLEEENDELKNKIIELKEKQNQINNNDIINAENKNQLVMLNDELSYLKLQLQLKDSENKRLNRIYSENMGLIKELNNDNKSYKEKLKLLTDKLNEVNSNNYQEINQVKEKLSLLNARNQSYEEQDNQIDKIFSEAILDLDKNGNDEETKNMIIAINDMPKGNNKRISQFKFLGNRLKKMAKDNIILNSKLQNALMENEKYKEESNLYQNIAKNNNEPYEYLLKEISKKDNELIYYKELVNEKDIRYKAVMKENEMLNEKYNAIEKDLKQHLENREKIDKLDYLVGKIVENQKKYLGGDKFVKFDNNQLVSKNTYKVGKNEPLKK